MNRTTIRPSDCHVLVVDDNPDVAETTGELIALTGCDVRVCHSGPEALAVAGDFHPDVAVLDLNMPGMDGAALGRWLKVQAGSRPLVLLAVTAMSADADRRRVQQAGFDRHLVKPVDPDLLLAEVVDAAVAAKATAHGVPADDARSAVRMGAKIDQVSAELRDRLAALAALAAPKGALLDHSHDRTRASRDRPADSNGRLGRGPDAQPHDVVDHIKRFADAVLHRPEGRQAAALACAAMYLVNLLRPGAMDAAHATAVRDIVDEVFAPGPPDLAPAPAGAPANGARE